MKPDVNSIQVHPQLNNNNFWMDGVLMALFIYGSCVKSTHTTMRHHPLETHFNYGWKSILNSKFHIDKPYCKPSYFPINTYVEGKY